MRRALRHQKFERDLEEAADYYLAEAGIDTALRFIDAVEALVDRLTRHPGLGSSHYADESNPDLRSLALKDFPYVVFFARTTDHIMFWRLLHGERDIPAHLRHD